MPKTRPDRGFRINEPTRAHRPRSRQPHLVQELVELGDLDSRAYADELARHLREPHLSRTLAVPAPRARLVEPTEEVPTA